MAAQSEASPLHADVTTNDIERLLPEISIGSTAVIRSYRTNVVIKCPHQIVQDVNVNHYQVEKRIYEILGLHARINT